MARGIPVDIGTQIFAKKGDASGFFKSMLAKYQPGDRVNDQDAAHLQGLLAHHEDGKEKIGSGVDHFEVMAAEFGSQCFCVVRTDGSRDDFSYHHCISNV